MKNKKTLGIIIVIIGFVLLILLIYFFFFYKTPQVNISSSNQVKKEEVKKEENHFKEVVNNTPDDRPRNYQKYDISSEPEHEFNIHDISKLAMVFTERFGSYSNQSDYSNFTNLKMYMTPKMKDWVDSYVKKLREQASSSNTYYGITTKVIITKVLKYDDKKGVAEILVTTQRKESNNNGLENKTYNQDLKINLLKQDKEWLVDKAYWQ